METMTSIRRLTLLLSVIAIALLLAGGMAIAATIIGTSESDDITGTAEADSLAGGGGNDAIEGLASGDAITGDDGHDVIWGGDTAGTTDDGDDISGGEGDDWIAGGRGADSVSGGPGNDTIEEFPTNEVAQDNVQGGYGDDVIDVANDTASKDLVSCGPGSDEVRVDSLDVVANDCEVVEQATANSPELDPTTDAPAEGPLTSSSGGDVQTSGFNCNGQSDNPHRSTKKDQVSAKARTWCENNQYLVYTKSELWRWRWSGWRFLDADESYQYYWWHSGNTRVAWGCNYRDDYWYKIISYHQAKNNGNMWDKLTSNTSDRKLLC